MAKKSAKKRSGRTPPGRASGVETTLRKNGAVVAAKPAVKLAAKAAGKQPAAAGARDKAAAPSKPQKPKTGTKKRPHTPGKAAKPETAAATKPKTPGTARKTETPTPPPLTATRTKAARKAETPAVPAPATTKTAAAKTATTKLKTALRSIPRRQEPGRGIATNGKKVKAARAPKVLPPPDRPSSMDAAPLVLWVASEAVPWGTTGGLGDVAGSLPAFLRRLGWDVRLVIPYYSQVTRLPVSPPIDSFTITTTTATLVTVHEAVDPPGGVPTYLLACGDLFTRNGLYGDQFGQFGDNAYRFAVFSRAAQELATRLPKPPAILHCHDWHTAWLPALLHLPGQRPAPLRDTRSILTIHNLQFQGDSGPEVLDHARLPRRLWHPDWGEHFGCLIPLKAGLMTAERVTTVSPSYAAEIRTSERGFGMDGILRARGEDLVGLLNGIDDVSWNPETDPVLTAPFSHRDLTGRIAGKRALLSELGLIPPDQENDQDDEAIKNLPLIAFVGRMTTEKGVDLIDEAIPELLATGAKIVILGTGNRDLEERLGRRQWQHHDDLRVVLRFDASLARRIYAAADLLLVPSRTEPCGLVQFYGLRYGAVPVVQAVGGLRDTILESTDPVRDKAANGFVFTEATPAALVDAVKRALRVFKNRAGWATMAARGMQQDWSWRRSALEYQRLYQELLASPIRTRHLPPSTGEPVPADPDFGPELPARLGGARFRLMVQSARTLFAYWEQDETQELELMVEERPSGRFLTGGTGLPASGDRWLSVHPDRIYRAFLRRPDGTIAALSNVVLTPGERATATADEAPDWQLAAARSGLFEVDPDGSKWLALFPDAPEMAFTKAARANHTIDDDFFLYEEHDAARPLAIVRPGGLASPGRPEAIDLVIRPHTVPPRDAGLAWLDDQATAADGLVPAPDLDPQTAAQQTGSAGIAFRSVLAGAGADGKPRASLLATSASFYATRAAVPQSRAHKPERPPLRARIPG